MWSGQVDGSVPVPLDGFRAAGVWWRGLLSSWAAEVVVAFEVAGSGGSKTDGAEEWGRDGGTDAENGS